MENLLNHDQINLDYLFIFLYIPVYAYEYTLLSSFIPFIVLLRLSGINF